MALTKRLEVRNLVTLLHKRDVLQCCGLRNLLSKLPCYLRFPGSVPSRYCVLPAWHLRVAGQT